MIPTSLFDAWAAIGPPMADHLWQSTLFAAVAGVLTLLLRKNHARVRHGLWLAASVKFLIPFSWLVAVGSQLGWIAADALPPDGFSVLIEPGGQSFAPAKLVSLVSAPVTPRSPASLLPVLFLGVWLSGCAAVLLAWWLRWRRVTAAVRDGARQAAGRELEILRRLEPRKQIELIFSRAFIEPGLFGIFRPVLLWPAGISDRLTEKQVEAIIAHELCHAQRRDNLAALIHMTVEAIFWFHPLVWWLGARLVDERERACDEEVVRLGNEPQTYAEGILRTCEFYLRSPLVCVAGVTGSNLKKRIERIMTHPITHHLNLARKLLLAAAGMTAVAVPVLVGIVNAPRSRARAQAGAAVSQPSETPLIFEVASIKPADPDARNSSLRHLPGGGLNVTNGVVRQLITFAYRVSGFQLSGGPAWIGSERYDIVAKPERPEGPDDLGQATEEQRTLVQERLRKRLRALLADRFQLTIHRETRELPVYALVLSKSGTKLQTSKDGSNQHMRMNHGEITAEGCTMQMLTMTLASVLGRAVLDQTGLQGRYDFTLEFMPEAGHLQGEVKPPGPGDGPEVIGPPDPSGRPSIFTAIQQQLGLKLESTKGPVEFIVIDRVERPSAN
jgi:uncharacterized protein (TIGR03435 family)